MNIKREAGATPVNFTKAKLERLKKAYNQAAQSSQLEFKFEGLDYVTAYAKYLIEYLDQVFNR